MNTLKKVQIVKDDDQSSYIKSIIEQEGAVILKNFISEEMASEVKKNLILALEEDNNKYGEDYIFHGMVHALMNRGKAFIDLISEKQLLSIFRAILGHGCIMHAYNSSSMPPNKTNFSRSIHVDCPRLIPSYITNMGLTIALDEFTIDNGAMEICPETFTMLNAPTEEFFNDKKVVLRDLKIGDAILFNARCWHRGGINNTSNWRHSVSMNICRAYMRQQIDFPAMLDQEKMEELSEDNRQFLGYNVRMPKNMEQFLLPQDKRLYKAGQE